MFDWLAPFAILLIEGRSWAPVNHNQAYFYANFGAEKGYHHCRGVMARCVLGGFGCQEDHQRAEFFADSSKDSHYGSFVHGYLAYEKGYYELAKNHWQKAANLGLAVAKVNLAKLYIEESTVLENVMRLNRDLPKEHTFLELIFLKKKAFDLLLEACQKGHPCAWSELTKLFNEGFRELAPGCSILSVMAQKK